MNPDNRWSEQQIHAFVDGELDAATAMRIEADAGHDPLLAAQIRRQRALRAQLSSAFDPVLDEPAPAQLLQALEGKGGAATPIGAARRHRPVPRLVAPRPLWWSAAAAAVLVAVLLGWSLPRDTGAMLVPGSGGLVAGGALDAALSQRTSAQQPGPAGIALALSFRAGDGRYCRVFRLDSGLDGLACRSGDAWLVEGTGRAAGTPADEYRQASSTFSAAVLAAISRSQAGEALTPEEEQRLIRNGDWR